MCGVGGLVVWEMGGHVGECGLGWGVAETEIGWAWEYLGHVWRVA